MGFPPQQSNENVLPPVNSPPSVSGLSNRQGRVRNERLAQFTRKIVHFLVPEGPIVQMYVNPQSIKYGYKKNITPTRTKGGFSIQYWGPDLIRLGVSGTTGTSGIEGINVLYDVYQNEQLAFDPFLFIWRNNSSKKLLQVIFLE